MKIVDTATKALSEGVSVVQAGVLWGTSDEERGEISDGYHTFNELYEFRKLYNALLFNEWAKKGEYNVHKSLRHYDGELCFGGGWFIVVADIEGQISNHYKIEDWDLFQIPEEPKAIFEYDGHTSKDVIERMTKLLNNENYKLRRI